MKIRLMLHRVTHSVATVLLPHLHVFSFDRPLGASCDKHACRGYDIADLEVVYIHLFPFLIQKARMAIRL